MVYVERKVAARIQQRMGPTLVGPYGLLQPLADIIKLAMKENLQPKAADPILFFIAPVISAAAAFTAFAVVPFGAETTFFGLLDQPVPLQVADVNVAILWVFAVTSMGVYGIVLAGWSSNSKYSLLGALRSAAQMISYELSYGTAIAAVILLANTMSIRGIVESQSGGFLNITRWFLWLQPIGFFIFMTAGVAETNRAPFDFPEAEQELVAGYHTEYSSMSFAMFFLAEYINMVTVSAIATNLYLGGWNGPLLHRFGLGWMWFLLKVAFLLFFYVWMRWTLPRYRYDQLMAFGWKFLLPLSVINLLVTAAGVLYFAP
jgi:NADH-quinone oxidoreductase subunit H